MLQHIPASEFKNLPLSNLVNQYLTSKQNYEKKQSFLFEREEIFAYW